MSAATITVDSWRVYGWNRGRWTLRSIHLDPAEAAEQAEYLHHRHGIRTRVTIALRTMPATVEPPPPTAAARFRQAQAARMCELRQATAYFKSGSNGTEVPQPPSPPSLSGALCEEQS